MKPIFFLLLFCLICASCDIFVPQYRFIDIKNDTNVEIAYCRILGSDTLLPKEKPPKNFILPNKFYRDYISRSTKRKPLKGDITIYFFSKTVWDSTSWDKVVKDNLYLKKINTTLDFISTQNNTVSYP